jgi:hypothetical protein
MHYAARQHSGDGVRDWWEERALTASYGLRPLYYRDHGEVPGLLGRVADLAGAAGGPSPDAPLVDIADWLDQVGDYESQQQSTWFATHWEAASRAITTACQPSNLSTDTWVAAARIERHLRHFVWFWLAPEERAAVRRQLWQQLAKAWRTLPPTETMPLWEAERIARALDWDAQPVAGEPDRALLEFALGAYEICGRDASRDEITVGWERMLEVVRKCAPESVVGRRVAVASRVWTMEASAALVGAARDACWEGMEAKLSLDIAEDSVLSNAASTAYATPRDWPGRIRDRLWMQSDHVRELSRVAGCNRREAGAVVIASFLAPTDQAESDLIAAYRRLQDLSGKLEPTSAWSVVVGLIAVFADQLRGFPDHELIDPLCEWLTEKCGQIPASDAVVAVVARNYARYWQRFHSRAASLAPQAAIRLAARAR